MKFSRYNVFAQNGDALFILNTLHGNFAKVIIDVDKIYSALMGDREIPQCHIGFMKKNYFVVDDDVDEFEECIKFSRSMVEGGNILNLIILPTEKCNFSCLYCYECHNGESLKEHDIDLIVEFAKKHLKGKRGLNVSWFGGEPLIKVSMIRKLSLKLLELCYSYKISYTADMTTNGYLLDSALVNELKKLHIYSYQVTIDGLCNTHDRQRYLTSGKGTWNKIIENLKDIKENCHSGVMRFVIRTNISREIYAEYKEFVNFLSSNFSRDSRFHFLFRPVSDWGNIDESVKDTFITQSEYEEIILYALNKELFNVALQIAITPGGNLCYAWKKIVMLYGQMEMLGNVQFL